MSRPIDNPHPIVKDVSKKTTTSIVIEAPVYSMADLDLIKPFHVYDAIRNIKDPEHPFSLEQLNVVQEDLVEIKDDGKDCRIKIIFVPTVPHCSLAATIALCMRRKLQQELPKPYKLDIFIKPGSHSTEHEINKQINDKERVSAAFENPMLLQLIEECIKPHT